MSTETLIRQGGTGTGLRATKKGTETIVSSNTEKLFRGGTEIVTDKGTDVL